MKPDGAIEAPDRLEIKARAQTPRLRITVRADCRSHQAGTHQPRQAQAPTLKLPESGH